MLCCFLLICFDALFVSLFMLCFRLPFTMRFFMMNHWSGLRPPAVGIIDTSFCCQLSVLPCSVLLWHATSCGWEVPERWQKLSAFLAPEWHLSGAINNFWERSVLGDTTVATLPRWCIISGNETALCVLLLALLALSFNPCSMAWNGSLIMCSCSCQCTWLWVTRWTKTAAQISSYTLTRVQQ